MHYSLNTHKLKGFSIDAAKHRLTVEPGVVWADVLKSLDKAGLMAVTGTCASVGITGFTLGGGHGWLSRQYGLSAYNLVEATLITADGKLHVVSAKSDPDLFWAIRGGSGNFGIIVSLTLRLHPVKDVAMVNVFYDITDAASILRAYRDWAISLPDYCTAFLAHFTLPDIPVLPEPIRGRKVIRLQVCSTDAFDEIFTLYETLSKDLPKPLLAQQDMRTYADMLLSEPAIPPSAGTDATALYGVLSDEAIEQIAGIMNMRDCNPAIEVRQWGGALANTDGDYGLLDYAAVGFSVFASVPATTDSTLMSRIITAITLGAQDRTLLNGTSNPKDISRVFHSNDYAHLQTMKKYYDPRNMFRHNHNIAS